MKLRGAAVGSSEAAWVLKSKFMWRALSDFSAEVLILQTRLFHRLRVDLMNVRGKAETTLFQSWNTTVTNLLVLVCAAASLIQARAASKPEDTSNILELHSFHRFVCTSVHSFTHPHTCQTKNAWKHHASAPASCG